MLDRLALALHAGARTVLAVLLLQAAVAVALAASLPDVGHVHPAGTADHVHALVEVGGLGTPALAPLPLPRPCAGAPLRPAPRPRAPRLRGPRRTRWGRAPPRPSPWREPLDRRARSRLPASV
jgi:hypothetical protein